MSDRYGSWKPYVSKAQRRAMAEQKISRMAKAGDGPQPVRIDGSAIARSFWGKGWCRHLETFSDYSNRLPRGRSYVRSGAVCHLDIRPGRVEARVSGTRMYTVEAHVAPLKPVAWGTLKQHCAGGIGSMIELLQGRLSEQVMRVVTDREHGLFPKPGEMKFTCSCPDWAGMCKHIAATLYGVGNRLDHAPELLFRLRGVDPAELIAAGFAAPLSASTPVDGVLGENQLGAIFGIELDDTPTAPSPAKAPSRKTAARKTPAPHKSVFRPTGTSIAALRRKLRLSVPDFAVRLSVSAASVQRWEAAGSTPLKLQARCLAALNALHQRPTMKLE